MLLSKRFTQRTLSVEVGLLQLIEKTLYGGAGLLLHPTAFLTSEVKGNSFNLGLEKALPFLG